MRKIVEVFFFLIAFYFVFQLHTATTNDKQAAKAKVKAVISDDQDVNWSDLPKYRLIAETNKWGYGIMVDTDKDPPITITPSQFDTWRNGLDNPARTIVIKVENYSGLAANGIEKIVEEPQ